jgi:16S rRNA (cytidine1402-2'-O)-methyltransferase
MYESPYRIVKLLEELKVLGLEQRRISVSREISKFFEQTVRGTVEEVLQHFLKQAPKGEFVVFLEGANQD